jgi:hypothetical protein
VSFQLALHTSTLVISCIIFAITAFMERDTRCHEIQSHSSGDDGHRMLTGYSSYSSYSPSSSYSSYSASSYSSTYSSYSSSYSSFSAYSGGDDHGLKCDEHASITHIFTIVMWILAVAIEQLGSFVGAIFGPVTVLPIHIL